MRKKIVFIIIFIVGNFYTINAQIFDIDQEEEINENVLTLMNRYIEFADLSSNGIEISDDYKNDFLSLFENQDALNIYNTLSFGQEFISARNFIDIVQTNYPHGVEVKAVIDTSAIKKYKKVRDDLYSVEFVCELYTIGITKTKKIKRKYILAHFIIYYHFDGDDFSDFKIVQILSEKYLLEVKSDNQMQGFYVAPTTSASSGRFLLPTNFDYYSQNYNLSVSYMIGVDFKYFFNSKYGISTGLEYKRFNSSFDYTYNNAQNLNLERVDTEGDTYFLFVNSNISEKTVFNIIEMPLLFTYKTNYAWKTSFFISAGLNFSLRQKSTINVSGSSHQDGYYPGYHLLVDDASSYGFGDKQYNDDYNFHLGAFFTSARLETGVLIPVNEKSYIQFGLLFQKSFTNLKYNQSIYRDDYFSLRQTANKASIENIGLSLSYIFKI